MLATSNRPHVNTTFRPTFFLVADIAKIAGALWVMLVMLSVTYENYVWWKATRSVHQAIVEHQQFVGNLNSYAQFGEEWRNTSDAIGVVARPMRAVTDGMRSSPMLMAVAGLIPKAEEVIVISDEISGGFLSLHEDVNGLLRMNVLVAKASHFEQNPNRYSLAELAQICEQQAAPLGSLDERLQFTFARLEDVNMGSKWLSQTLAPMASVQIPLVGRIQILQSAIDRFTTLADLASQESVKMQSRHAAIQRDLALMQLVISATRDAQLVEQKFGTGAWRRFMRTVDQNPFLFLSLSVALLMIEACLDVEQKRQLRST